MTDTEKKLLQAQHRLEEAQGAGSRQGAKSPHSQAHSGGCNSGKGAAGGADDGAACAGGVSFTEAGKRNLNFRWEVSGETGGLPLFSPEGRTYSPPRRGVVFPAEIVRSARRMRLLRQPPDNATAPASAAVIVCGSQLFPFWKQSAPCPHKPATGSFICGYDPKLYFGLFSLLRKRNRKRKNEVKKIWRFIIWKRRWSAGAQGALPWPPPLI